MPPTLPTAPDLDVAPPTDLRLSRRELALIAAFWTLFAALTVANRLFGAGGEGPGPQAASLPRAFAVAFTESLCWALLTPPVFWLAGRGAPEHRGGARLLRVVAFLAIGAAAASAVALIGHEVRGVFGPPPGLGGPRGPGPRRRGPQPGGPPWIAFANAFLTYLGVYAAGLARAFSLRYRARHDLATRLQAQLAEARLDALRRQLDPHFLFNTLNAVSALVERDPRGVRRMIARLSDLLRHSFEGPNEPEVPLRDELALLGRYVDIMQVRFQGRLTVDTRADERALDALVPSMILQPLVENAIKHGVERIAGPGRIEIDATLAGDELVLRVADNGPGPGTPGAAREGGGVGLRNTVARLAQLHGGERFMLAARPEGGAVATVRLPFRSR